MNEEEFDEFVTRVTVAVAARLVVGLALIVAVPMLVGVWMLQNEQDERIEDINRSRAEISHTACLDQNSRHDATIDRLDELIDAAVAREPAREREIRASRASTLILIEALAPQQDCEQLSMERFGYVPDVG